MCGIVGVRRFDGRPVDVDLLAFMAKRLVHRGPDDIGFWSDSTTGLAHTRLSIIDLGSSKQPMASHGGRQHLVFNGEILNYRQLRAELPYPIEPMGTPKCCSRCTSDLALRG